MRQGQNGCSVVTCNSHGGVTAHDCFHLLRNKVAWSALLDDVHQMGLIWHILTWTLTTPCLSSKITHNSTLLQQNLTYLPLPLSQHSVLSAPFSFITWNSSGEKHLILLFSKLTELLFHPPIWFACPLLWDGMRGFAMCSQNCQYPSCEVKYLSIGTVKIRLPQLRGVWYA